MQLKVEDLRVGNAFVQRGSYFIETATLEDLQAIAYGRKIAEAVRFTENHLLNLGFEETSRNGYYRLADLLVSVEGQIYFGSEETWICECYFIHEIQNLAKSLFKFELEHNLCN